MNESPQQGARRLGSGYRPVATAVLIVAVLRAATRSGAAEEIFVDVAAASGLGFVHFNGMSGELYLVENTGQGTALLDYDNDGDLDVYLLQGAMLGPGKTIADATFAPRHPLPLTDRLYRNDLAWDGDGRPVLAFVDVTEASGAAATGYGMGVAAGDYDNDGWTDLYVANYGSNHLLRNNGDGTFSDRIGESGADDVRWSVPAVFFDYDGDGWLDLFVGNYLEFPLALHSPCPTATGLPNYCSPVAYRAQSDRLFHNRGDGTFEDVTRSAGLETEFGRALGAIAADFDGDGWTDLYVANDQSANQLWINREGQGFTNEALLAGCALNWQGQAEASMGVDAADVDGDGDEDLFMGHFGEETNTLYLNDGRGNFRDATPASGLGTPSWPYTTFGVLWLDYDNDGRLDVLTVNGAVAALERLARAGDPYPLKEPNQLFRQQADGRFVEASREAGATFGLLEVSRGTAAGDVDNDGDADVLLANNAGPARLLMNQRGQEQGWVGVRVLSVDARDDAGARVKLLLADGRRPTRSVRTDGSYASASDPRILFGLGEGDALAVRIHRQRGSVQEWRPVATGRYLIFGAPRRP